MFTILFLYDAGLVEYYFTTPCFLEEIPRIIEITRVSAHRLEISWTGFELKETREVVKYLIFYELLKYYNVFGRLQVKLVVHGDIGP